MTGVNRNAIEDAVASGLVEQRSVDGQRWRPSLRRESVAVWAEGWKARQAQAEAKRIAAAKAAEDWLSPPDGEYVWLNAEAAAAVLQASRVRVGQWVREDRLPHVRKGRRMWFRRDLIEQIAAARVARRKGPTNAGDRTDR